MSTRGCFAASELGVVPISGMNATVSVSAATARLGATAASEPNAATAVRKDERSIIFSSLRRLLEDGRCEAERDDSRERNRDDGAGTELRSSTTATATASATAIGARRESPAMN